MPLYRRRASAGVTVIEPREETSQPSSEALGAGVGRAASIVIASILASRLLGFVRQAAINAEFGVEAEADAWFAAFRIPDSIFMLLAGGALLSAVNPRLRRGARARRPASARPLRGPHRRPGRRGHRDRGGARRPVRRSADAPGSAGILGTHRRAGGRCGAVAHDLAGNSGRQRRGKVGAAGRTLLYAPGAEPGALQPGNHRRRAGAGAAYSASPGWCGAR